jgi:hypothetical protein
LCGTCLLPQQKTLQIEERLADKESKQQVVYKNAEDDSTVFVTSLQFETIRKQFWKIFWLKY